MWTEACRCGLFLAVAEGVTESAALETEGQVEVGGQRAIWRARFGGARTILSVFAAVGLTVSVLVGGPVPPELVLALFFALTVGVAASGWFFQTQLNYLRHEIDRKNGEIDRMALEKQKLERKVLKFRDTSQRPIAR